MNPFVYFAFCYEIYTLFAWLISHQPAVLFSHNKPATSNQPAVLFPQNKPAPVISHQPTEQAARLKIELGLRSSSPITDGSEGVYSRKSSET
jgi:hypothetical protein